MGIEIRVAALSMEAGVAFVVWLVAVVVSNWAYLDYCWRGERGFRRLAAFWIGFPFTFVTALMAKEGKQPAIREDDEGLDLLLDDIRRDRRKRLGPETESETEE